MRAISILKMILLRFSFILKIFLQLNFVQEPPSVKDTDDDIDL